VKIYLAGPLFTTPEREFNVQLATRLRAAGHEVFVPQEHPAADRTGKAIFVKDLAGLDWAEGVVAIMDGADPDSGTCWECGYAYATKKRVVLFRSDFRGSGDADDIAYNAMLIGSADARVELRLGSVDEAAAAINAELVRLADRSSPATAEPRTQPSPPARGGGSW
jgi:nucleoside 2-deoxyribosyltransferase